MGKSIVFSLIFKLSISKPMTIRDNNSIIKVELVDSRKFPEAVNMLTFPRHWNILLTQVYENFTAVTLHSLWKINPRIVVAFLQYTEKLQFFMDSCCLEISCLICNSKALPFHCVYWALFHLKWKKILYIPITNLYSKNDFSRKYRDSVKYISRE